MRTLVCFSGGYDSTAVLLNELDINHIVDTCYFKIPNNSNAQIIELKRRKKILKTINKFSSKGKLGDDFIIDIYNTINNQHLIISLAYLWIQCLVISMDLTKYDRIVFGYVKYDDFWHYKTEIGNIYNTSKILSMKQVTAKLDYPFEWMDKTGVSKWYDTEKYHHNDTKKYIDKIKKLTFYCEEPENGVSCKKCNSCIRHKRELE